MDYSQQNNSFSKDKNEVSGNNKNFDENKSKRNFGNEFEYSETLSDEVDELSVIRFMIERNFFDNSENKLIGNMTFLNKIFEISKDTSSLKNKASNQNLKDNLKQVMEYLIENKNLYNENSINSNNPKLSENLIDNNKPQDYKIKVICPSPKFSDDNFDNNKLKIKTLNDINCNSKLDKMPNHPNSLNEEIKRINNLKPNFGNMEKNYKPSISPLKIYKNIENKSENILNLFNDLKKIDVNNNANIIKSESLNDCNNINSYNIPILNIAQVNLNANEPENSLSAESNLSVKCNDDDKTTKSINLSTIYENYQKELNRFKAKKENAKKILKFTNFNFKDMKEKKPLEELEEIPEIDLLNFGLIIEGDAITHCMDNELSQMFWTLIKKSRSIICCRCNPIQKSQIVNFVKIKSSQICLAIGDGGNDVNMIKAANVGIGIFGKEGYQAAYSSDYAISEFKYLRRLLFYHGRYFILRNSYFIYFFFYKSLIFNIPNLWFAFFSGFSGTLLWDSIYFLLYTSILTTMPPVVPMIYEEDIDIEMEKYPNRKILRNLIPDIYKETRDISPFNSLKFLFVFIMGCLHSAVIFFVPLFVFGMGNQDHLGRSQSIWDHSLVGIVTILIVQYYILIQDTYLFNFPVICAHGIQIAVNVIFFNIYACLGSDELGLYTYDVISNFKFWFSFLLILFISLIPVIISRKIEFFLSQNIVNNLRNRNFEDDYTRKICVKKIEQMHKCSRSLAKFRKIYYANKNKKTMNIQNLADKKMKEIVDQYKKFKKTSKSKMNKREENTFNKEVKLENYKIHHEVQNSYSLKQIKSRIIKNETPLDNENQGKILQILIKNKAKKDFIEDKNIDFDFENSNKNPLDNYDFNSDEIHEKIDQEKNNSILRIVDKKI